MEPVVVEADLGLVDVLNGSIERRAYGQFNALELIVVLAERCNGDFARQD